ncbi:MAG: MEDS domain-containing protein [Solirubrobacterales bacterium]
MPAFECLVCGTSFYSLGQSRSRCHTCGGDHFHASAPGQSAHRFPRSFYPGEHASLIYKKDERLLDLAVPYIRAGLASDQRVVVVLDGEARDLICARLRADEAGAVDFVAPADIYGDPFDASRTRDLHAAMVDEADEVVRLLGGLDRGAARSIDPAEYALLEHQSEALFDKGLVALCLFDARYCSVDLLDVAAAHPLLAGGDVVHLAA